MSSNKMIENHLALMTLTDAVKPKIQFGEWQLCPKCNGTGLLQPPYRIEGTSILTGTCDVCNGAKILARPIINMNIKNDK